MKLLFVLDRLNLGGAERHTLALGQGLAGLGHEVETAVLWDDGSPAFPIGDFPRRPRVIAPAGRRSTALGQVGRLAALIADVRPDHVLAVNQRALMMASLGRMRSRCSPSLSCIFHTTLLPSRAARLKAEVFRAFVMGIDGLVFVSRNQMEYWTGQGLRARRTVAIRNGIAPSHHTVPSPEARAQARQRIGIEPKDVVFLQVGRFAPEKNHLATLEALAALLAQGHPDAERARVVFVGEGPTRSIVQDRCRSLNLGDRVVFAGSFTDVRPLLATGDVGLLVSTSVETFSLAALEMMATGLPMIMTDIGGASEIISDGHQGCLIPPSDHPALVSAFARMLDPGYRLPMGRAARARVEAEFTDDRMLAEYSRYLEGGVLS